MLLALRQILDGGTTLAHPDRGEPRPGVHRELGPPYRRSYTVMGDTTNLAARVMGKSRLGQLWATPGILERSTTTFETVQLEPFAAKGKAALVQAYAVGPPLRVRPGGRRGRGARVGRAGSRRSRRCGRHWTRPGGDTAAWSRCSASRGWARPAWRRLVGRRDGADPGHLRVPPGRGAVLALARACCVDCSAWPGRTCPRRSRGAHRRASAVGLEDHTAVARRGARPGPAGHPGHRGPVAAVPHRPPARGGDLLTECGSDAADWWWRSTPSTSSTRPRRVCWPRWPRRWPRRVGWWWRCVGPAADPLRRARGADRARPVDPGGEHRVGPRGHRRQPAAAAPRRGGRGAGRGATRSSCWTCWPRPAVTCRTRPRPRPWPRSTRWGRGTAPWCAGPGPWVPPSRRPWPWRCSVPRRMTRPGPGWTACWPPRRMATCVSGAPRCRRPRTRACRSPSGGRCTR